MVRSMRSTARILRTALGSGCLLLALAPGAHTATAIATVDDLSPALNQQGEVTLVGVHQRIAMGGEQSPMEVAELWERFQGSPALHYAVNWSAPVAIYALYSGFSTQNPTISLTIGYLESALLRPAQHPEWARRPIPTGRYLNYTAGSGGLRATLEPEGRVRSAWQRLDRDRLPTAILERYTIGADGGITQADVLVLYR